MKPTRLSAALAATVLTGVLAGAGTANAGGFPSFIGPLHHTTVLSSTVPGNGDVNPYGVAVVPRTTGNLFAGNVLVSNFNDKANVQGTGTTIVSVNPRGGRFTFARISQHLRGCPGGVGLTTALVVLRSGWVIVGSLPTMNTKNGAVVTGSGCLIVLDRFGRVRETFTAPDINGPWDMTAADYGSSAALFVTNVLNGTVAAAGKTVDGGTVIRLDVRIPFYGLPFVAANTIIGSGFGETLNSSALVIGPTGVGLGRDGSLYVADTLASRIARIPDAVNTMFNYGTGSTVTSGGWLNGELGLAVASDGDILTVNAANGYIVETTPSGTQVARRLLNHMGSPPGSGALFGLAVVPRHDAVYYVDDDANTLDLFF